MSNEVGTNVEPGGEVNVIYADSASGIAGLDPHMRQVARSIETWTNNLRAATGSISLFDRGKYVSTDNVYDQMRTARQAVKDDDVVSSAVELTEGLAFQGVKWEDADWDTMDLFNQMAAEQNLDGLVRKMWREEFTQAQVALAFWWDSGEFTVRGETDKGNKRKKTVKVTYPRVISVLDPTRIVPVGMLAFGQERLAWRATDAEIRAYQDIASGRVQDPVMERFYAGQYVVTDPEEARELTSQKVDITRLLLLDERYVSRHTLTRADYERWPSVRLKSVFRLLDLKQQLMEADRVALVGAANYILLVKKGDDKDPAYPEEIQNLKDNYHTLAKMPVIFSDHRLNIEIITPKQDYTLMGEKYDALDNRIVARLFNTLTAPGSRSGQRSDNTMTLSRPVARSMENRRHMMRRYLEKEIAKAVVDHPANAGIFTQGPPSLAYSPPNIQLDADAGTAAVLMQARTMRDLSRESFLEYFGFDQEVEAMRMELEADKYDDIFKTAVPFNSPQNNPAGADDGTANKNPANGGGAPVTQATNGQRGGRPAGGGKPSQSPQSAPKRTAKGTTSTGAGQ